MTRRFQILLPVLIAVILFFGCGRKPGEKLYQEALAEWDAGNPVRARALLEKSIHRRVGSKENAEAYNRLGLLLRETGDIDGAVNAFNESCRIEPGRADVLCNLGVALSEQRNFTAAEHAFREAALMMPNDSRPLIYAGTVFLQNGKWNEAIRNLQRAVERTPNNPQLQNALALAELHADGPDAALKRLQVVVGQHPNYAPAYFNIAMICLNWQNNPAVATRWFNLYLEKAPEKNVFVEIARNRIKEAGSAKAGLQFNAPKKRNRADAEKLFRKALEYHKANKLDKAEAGYIKAIESDDTYEQAFYNLGLVYYAQDRMNLAAEAFEKAVQINPAFVAARYNCALVAYRQGNNDRARRELQIILSSQPDYQPAKDLAEQIETN